MVVTGTGDRGLGEAGLRLQPETPTGEMDEAEEGADIVEEATRTTMATKAKIAAVHTTVANTTMSVVIMTTDVITTTDVEPGRAEERRGGKEG